MIEMLMFVSRDTVATGEQLSADLDDSMTFYTFPCFTFLFFSNI